MLDQLISFTSNIIQKLNLFNMESELSVIVSCVTLIGIGCNAFIFCTKFIHWSYYKLRQQRPIDSLYKSLIGHSTVSKAEVIYQIRSYITPQFVKRKETIRHLIRQIKKSSGKRQSSAAIFSIIGDPACGKTTTMRYLYCRLANIRNCVYFQMQDVTSMSCLNLYLYKQKIENQLSDHTPVIAFFDGLDEACAFFQKENPVSMQDAFQSIFFCGIYSKIHEAF